MSGLRFQRGQPRTRPPVRRMTLEIDEDLLNLVGDVAGTLTFRMVVQEALKLWLAQQGVSYGAEDILADHAMASPPTPSDSPKGR